MKEAHFPLCAEGFLLFIYCDWWLVVLLFRFFTLAIWKLTVQTKNWWTTIMKERIKLFKNNDFLDHTIASSCSDINNRIYTTLAQKTLAILLHRCNSFMIVVFTDIKKIQLEKDLDQLPTWDRDISREYSVANEQIHRHLIYNICFGERNRYNIYIAKAMGFLKVVKIVTSFHERYQVFLWFKDDVWWGGLSFYYLWTTAY